MIGFRRLATVVLLAPVAAGAACRASGSARSADQPVAMYRADLRLTPSGTLYVAEAFSLARTNGAGQQFRRRIPADRFDRIDLPTIAFDNRAASQISSRGRSGGLDVAAPLQDGEASRIELTYRVSGAVAVRGGRGLLTWAGFPAGHPFAFDTALVVLHLPDRMPAASTPPAPGPGWTVRRVADGWGFDGARVASGTPIAITADLALDPNAVAEPEWQALETRTRQLMPAFVSAGLFILVTGAGAIWMIRWQFSPRNAVDAPRELDPSAVARGLRTAGWVLIVFGLLGAAATWRWFTFFGAWPVVVPLSISVVGAAFFPESARLRAHQGIDLRNQ